MGQALDRLPRASAVWFPRGRGRNQFLRAPGSNSTPIGTIILTTAL
jgi:hypothetical protein